MLESSFQTPAINFSSDSGLMTIKGRSIPDNAVDFWSVVIDWFDKYMEQPAIKTEFHIDLEYFNIASSKSILILLYKLNELKEKGLDAKVQWFYHESEEDMLQVGQDYAFMVHVPFEFTVYAE